MKKVRFETTLNYSAMNDLDCQSPRPFLEKKSISNVPCIEYDFARVVPYNNDPLQRYECGNGSPYPTINKTRITELSKIESKWTPSNDLDLSLLDTYAKMPRSSVQETNVFKHPNHNGSSCVVKNTCDNVNSPSRVLSSLENKYQNPPNILSKNDSFFIQRENLHQMSCQNIERQFKKITLDKENNPLVAKNKLIKIGVTNPLSRVSYNESVDAIAVPTDHCQCHQCTRLQVCTTTCVSNNLRPCGYIQSSPRNITNCCNKQFSKQISNHCQQCNCKIPMYTQNCKKCPCDSNYSPDNDINAVDKKTWALKRYEESNADTLNAEKQVVKEKGKEKREPSVADLFKIIKLQNEQLQLLQEKVDKFISASKFETQKQTLPIQNYVTEHVAVETMDKEHHKISIGVMTSFEVVRTSTIINKEILTQCSEAQIQCNRSQISIKEVQPVHLNFLDGITPVSKSNNEGKQNTSSFQKELPVHAESCNKDGGNEEKTYNEMSLYSVQVDNAITPLMSPEQSMYLDVRDYSDSESEPEDQSNVGWTYYNKVMAHVNGMLHDSDMPSSASALYRNTRQKCMQMKIDKTNVSVIKRVKFGDDPIVMQQHHTASTDTSLKMKQLAAKYLKNGHVDIQTESPRPVAPIDMSFATRNYMEKHQLLQGIPMKSSNGHVPIEIPRFLDITALKQQPKLL